MKLKQFIHIAMYTLGWATLVTSTLLIYFLFIIAYFNGNDVVVTINDYGEAKIEMILLIISLPCWIYVAWKKVDFTTDS